MNQDTLWLAGSIVVMGTAAAFWLRKRIKLRRARSWPMAEGLVESTNVRLEGSGTQQSRYVAEMSYFYPVQGQFYSGRLRRTFLLHDRAHRWADSYPSGRPLIVRYNPAHMQDSVVFEQEQTEGV